ncbi:MAG: hypothetical protein RL264_1780 [Bacteroidota bacterium]
MEFDLPRDINSVIKVIGVGGGGSNAVNHMYKQGIVGVDFIVCNTDRQALDISPVPYKIQLGAELTEGRGAGMMPEVGMNAALENIEEIRDLLSKNTKMVFVTAGMGGGTGTGAAPVIAQVAKDLGILTVGIVTVPFAFEGRKRTQQAEDGLEKMRQNVDTLLVINNEKLRQFGKSMSLTQAFTHADDILTVAAKGIAELISVTGIINVDFNDVNTVLRNSGHAIMGSAIASGDNRAMEAVQSALTSPLLNDNDIHGARYVLLNITYGDKEVMMDEITEITDFIQTAAGDSADVIWGHGYDSSLGEGLSITLIATGFSSTPITGFEKAPEMNLINMDAQQPKAVDKPLSHPFESNLTSAATMTEALEKDPVLASTLTNQTTVSPEPVTYSQPIAPAAPVATPVVNEIPTYVAPSSPLTPITSNIPVESVSPSSNVEPTAPSTPVFENVREVTNEIKLEETAPQEQIQLEWPVERTEVKFEPVASKPEQKVHILNEDLENKRALTPEESNALLAERTARIQSITSKLKRPEGLADLEKEPAYKRFNLSLDNSDNLGNEISGYSLGKDSNGNINLSNNGFLHTNVD